MNNLSIIINKLSQQHSLTNDEYKMLLLECSKDDVDHLARLARKETEKIYGKNIYIRGLIEISNYCKNDCYYCGIRASNTSCDRYRLTDDDILECCKEGYALGFRTFVLQGGEDPALTDDIICNLVSKIKELYPDCAITLSLGERSKESYKKMKQAGADRYLLRHETATAEHYALLHPSKMSFDNRIRCLYDLRNLGFQVGCGFMVGSPEQTPDMLAEELKFIETFKPDMCGIGPFIPHVATKYHNYTAGSVDMTCLLLSIIRLIHPCVLLPATTALGTLAPNGREKGILSGANVIMPNLSPASVRKKYMIYDNKLSDGDESASALDSIKNKINSIGYNIITSRGDVYKPKK
ncbi:MAG: [FeFe] hydrogenase H-cluster radical SAM maturase HydE [Clostridia bacterium]|nr:[FeFe] hydrogenase H-cluster radical SAM maturase HydE [Clostridia bacterium]